jgi:hypothetical protein
MPLKTSVLKIDDVAEPLRSLYVEQPDKSWELEIEEDDGKPATVRGLKAKVRELLPKRQALIEQVDGLKAKLAVIPEDFDPEAYKEMQDKLAKLEAAGAGAGGDPTKINELVSSTKTLYEQKLATQQKKADERSAKLQKALDDETAITRKLLIHDGLTKALVENGVGREFLKAAQSMLQASALVEDEGGERVAKIKTVDGEKVDLAKYVADWASSDEGKPFVTPAKGGGAEGGQGGGKGNDADNPWIKGKNFNLTRQGQILVQDRAKAERLSQQAAIVNANAK